MNYLCKLCNGKGKQSSGLTCISCRGRGFFDLKGKVIEPCNSCKGTGRAAIKTLPCTWCSGKGFFALSEAAGTKSFRVDGTKAPEKEEPKTPEAVKNRIKKENADKKKTIVEEEFGIEHLDDLKEQLTKILESRW